MAALPAMGAGMQEPPGPGTMAEFGPCDPTSSGAAVGAQLLSPLTDTSPITPKGSPGKPGPDGDPGCLGPKVRAGVWGSAWGSDGAAQPPEALGCSGGINGLSPGDPVGSLRKGGVLTASQEWGFADSLVFPARGCLGSLAWRGHKDLWAPM